MRSDPRLVPASVVLPRLVPLATASDEAAGGALLAIEHSPRRMAFQAALDDFLELLIAESDATTDVLPGLPDRARAHFEGMFRVTLHGLLLSADLGACGVFLLDNAHSVARRLPQRLAAHEQQDVAQLLSGSRVYGIARNYAAEIWHWAGEVAGEVARESVDAEVAVFPHLLTLLRDNVLVYSHQHPPELVDLNGYIESLWGIPGAGLVASMVAAEESLYGHWQLLPEWMREVLVPDGASTADFSCRWPGLMTRFAESGAEGAPDHGLAQVWEQLNLRRDQHRLLSDLSSRIVALERRERGWRAVEGNGGQLESNFPPDLRPLALFSAQGTGSTVQRFGLRYDISNFSTTMASLEMMPTAEREAALRRFFFFQRRVQNAARRHGLHLEKYFGDGVLFSSPQSAREVLAAAVEIQRAYRQAVDRGMVFTGGIRLAANWGAYRVVAQVGDFDSESGSEGQLFGPGIVEISRLVSGKVSRDLTEIKKLLNGAGYSREEVKRFFARFDQRDIQVVDDATESRRFWAYVNPNGTLVNEGIVVTAGFLARLLATVEGIAGRHREGGREFLILNLASCLEAPLLAGVTHRGFAEFKGLAPIEVFEVVDTREWGDDVSLDGRPDDSIDASRFSWLPSPVRD